MALEQLQINFDSNIYYEIHPLLNRAKKLNLIGVYGLTASGKKSFCEKLRAALNSDGWYTTVYASDLYFKYSREARTRMLETAWKRFGSNPDYDAVQKEAFSIKENELDEDLVKLSSGNSVYRENMYKRLTGELYGTLSIDTPSRMGMVAIMSGMWISGFRKRFNGMIRVEASYETRRRRFEQRGPRAMETPTPWVFEPLDRIIEADIFKNWDLNDIAVRSNEGFQLK